eukprot:5297006-Amphidinium_carterae.3
MAAAMFSILNMFNPSGVLGPPFKLTSSHHVLENGTDDKHSWYIFHTKIEFAIGDFLNIYLYNHPQEYLLQDES